MLEDGTISELRSKWFPSKWSGSCSRTSLGERKVQADGWSVVTLFMLWAAGAAAAATVLILESSWEAGAIGCTSSTRRRIVMGT